MRQYYAIFRESQEAIEVEFPDLPGCVTFGQNWDEAVENAIDVLAGWLANAEPQFIRKPSKHKDLEHLQGLLIPIAVDAEALENYMELKRVNIVLPVKVLNRIDAYRKNKGLKRSKLIQMAAEAFLKSH